MEGRGEQPGQFRRQGDRSRNGSGLGAFLWPLGLRKENKTKPQGQSLAQHKAPGNAWDLKDNGSTASPHL